MILAKYLNYEFLHKNSIFLLALQECQTDSEELLYKSQIKIDAPPPDVVLHPCKSPPIKVATEINYTVVQKEIKSNNKSNKSPAIQISQKEKRERLKKRHSIATTRNFEELERDNVKFEEVCCDVSFSDNSKGHNPIQLSFTLYDLNGNGKITKDDIAGIVSSIYESVGNSSVDGKRTINVKFTVSSEQDKNHNQSETTPHLTSKIKSPNNKSFGKFTNIDSSKLPEL